jgi:sugar (pentulose or hexulose) kinase
MDTRVSTPYTHTDDTVRYVTTSSGYLTHRLTGRFLDTAANYRGSWPTDADRWQWSTDEQAVADAGIPRSMLFDLVLPGAVLGHLTAEAARHTGLREGLPVVATANDKAVEALGSGLRSPESVLLSLGTYIAGMTTGERDVPDARRFWSNFASVPYEYLYESGGIRRGMWTVSWLTGLLGGSGEAPERVLERLNAGAADVPPGSDGLMTVLDWLAPAEAPYRKGAILGFDARHGPFHIYRSVLEGIALTLYDRVGAMREELGAEFKRVTVSGGGASSELMMRIVADVFGLPAARMTHTDAAGLGAAICAGTGLGVFTTVDDAIEAMVAVDTRFEPDPANHQRYLAEHQVYRDITRHTDEIFTSSSRIFG